MSRIKDTGHDYQTYNRIILFGSYAAQGNAKFIEGFAAKEILVEGNTSTFEFRKQTSTPIEHYEIDRFKVVGDYRGTGPLLRSWFSLTLVPFGLNVSYEHSVFNCRFRDCNASYGQEINAYQTTLAGTNTNISLYNRDVRTINGQRNILSDRRSISPSPPPETVTEKILEGL